MPQFLPLMFLKRLWQQPRKNAQNNSVNVFYQSKHSQAEDLKQQFDIIVSDPYVRNLEKKKSRKTF
jgi:methylase of polypeptide subunit release factors